MERRARGGLEGAVDRDRIVGEFMAPTRQQLRHKGALVERVAALTDDPGKAAYGGLILRLQGYAHAAAADLVIGAFAQVHRIDRNPARSATPCPAPPKPA